MRLSSGTHRSKYGIQRLTLVGADGPEASCHNFPSSRPAAQQDVGWLKVEMSASVPDATLIRALAAKLQTLTPRDSNQIALLGFMVGVLYSLDRAVALGFEDTRMKLDAAVERTEHRRTLQALTQGSTVDAPWLAGFYLDSAMMRLAALNERIGTYLGANHDVAAQIRKLVNKIKHEVDPGIGRGWTI